MTGTGRTLQGLLMGREKFTHEGKAGNPGTGEEIVGHHVDGNLHPPPGAAFESPFQRGKSLFLRLDPSSGQNLEKAPLKVNENMRKTGRSTAPGHWSVEHFVLQSPTL